MQNQKLRSFQRSAALAITVFAAVGLCKPSTSLALDANQIIKTVDDRREIKYDTSFIVDVQDVRGSDVQRTKYKVFNKGMKMSRVETLYPERQAGRKLLMKNDDLWLFTPDIKRPTRVSLQQKLTGEVANGDIVRTSFFDDYTAALTGEEKIQNVLCYRLALTKKREEVTYAAVDLWVSKKDFAPVKADFKTANGKSLKTALYSKPITVLNSRQYTKVEITSSLDAKQKSILNFSAYKKETLDESFFNKESLNN